MRTSDADDRTVATTTTTTYGHQGDGGDDDEQDAVEVVLEEADTGMSVSTAAVHDDDESSGGGGSSSSSSDGSTATADDDYRRRLDDILGDAVSVPETSSENSDGGGGDAIIIPQPGKAEDSSAQSAAAVPGENSEAAAAGGGTTALTETDGLLRPSSSSSNDDGDYHDGAGGAAVPTSAVDAVAHGVPADTVVEESKAGEPSTAGGEDDVEEREKSQVDERTTATTTTPTASETETEKEAISASVAAAVMKDNCDDSATTTIIRKAPVRSASAGDRGTGGGGSGVSSRLLQGTASSRSKAASDRSKEDAGRHREMTSRLMMPTASSQNRASRRERITAKSAATGRGRGGGRGGRRSGATTATAASSSGGRTPPKSRTTVSESNSNDEKAKAESKATATATKKNIDSTTEVVPQQEATNAIDPTPAGAQHDANATAADVATNAKDDETNLQKDSEPKEQEQPQRLEQVEIQNSASGSNNEDDVDTEPIPENCDQEELLSSEHVDDGGEGQYDSSCSSEKCDDDNHGFSACTNLDNEKNEVTDDATPLSPESTLSPTETYTAGGDDSETMNSAADNIELDGLDCKEIAEDVGMISDADESSFAGDDHVLAAQESASDTDGATSIPAIKQESLEPPISSVSPETIADSARCPHTDNIAEEHSTGNDTIEGSNIIEPPVFVGEILDLGDADMPPSGVCASYQPDAAVEKPSVLQEDEEAGADAVDCGRSRGVDVEDETSSTFARQDEDISTPNNAEPPAHLPNNSGLMIEETVTPQSTDVVEQAMLLVGNFSATNNEYTGQDIRTTETAADVESESVPLQILPETPHPVEKGVNQHEGGVESSLDASFSPRHGEKVNESGVGSPVDQTSTKSELSVAVGNLSSEQTLPVPEEVVDLRLPCGITMSQDTVDIAEALTEISREKQGTAATRESDRELLNESDFNHAAVEHHSCVKVDHGGTYSTEHNVTNTTEQESIVPNISSAARMIQALNADNHVAPQVPNDHQKLEQAKFNIEECHQSPSCRADVEIGPSQEETTSEKTEDGNGEDKEARSPSADIPVDELLIAKPHKAGKPTTSDPLVSELKQFLILNSFAPEEDLVSESSEQEKSRDEAFFEKRETAVSVKRPFGEKFGGWSNVSSQLPVGNASPKSAFEQTHTDEPQDGGNDVVADVVMQATSENKSITCGVSPSNAEHTVESENRVEDEDCQATTGIAQNDQPSAVDDDNIKTSDSRTFRGCEGTKSGQMSQSLNPKANAHQQSEEDDNSTTATTTTCASNSTPAAVHLPVPLHPSHRNAGSMPAGSECDAIKKGEGICDDDRCSIRSVSGTASPLSSMTLEGIPDTISDHTPLLPPSTHRQTSTSVSSSPLLAVALQTPSSVLNARASLGSSNSFRVNRPKRIADFIRVDLWSKDPDVVETALLRVHEASVGANNDSNRATIARSGGLLAIVNSMETHMSVPGIQVQACKCFEVLALDPDNELAIGDVGGIEAIFSAMMLHFDDETVQEAAWSALWNLSCNSADEQMVAVETLGGMSLLVQCIQRHSGNPEVQKNACGTLTNLCVDHEERMTALVEAGGLVAIATALQNHWKNDVVRKEASHAMSMMLRNDDLESHYK